MPPIVTRIPLYTVRAVGVRMSYVHSPLALKGCDTEGHGAVSPVSSKFVYRVIQLDPDDQAHLGTAF